MGVILSVAIGGAVGSILRYLISKYSQSFLGISFPIGTLLVNLIGTFLIGFFFSYLVEKIAINPYVRGMLITGFLGGFTTFSTFSYESLTLLREGELLKFILYFVGTNLLGISGTFLGYKIGEAL